jgi:hypothetical protein
VILAIIRIRGCKFTCTGMKEPQKKIQNRKRNPVPEEESDNKRKWIQSVIRETTVTAPKNWNVSQLAWGEVAK